VDFGWRDLATVVASITGGSLTGLLTYRIKIRHDESESERNDAETLGTESLTAKRLYDEGSELRHTVRALDEHVAELQHEVFYLTEENEALKNLIPEILLVAQVMDFDRVRRVFDEALDGWVVSVADEGGRFKWVNVAFAAALNMTRDEVISMNWRGLVLPEFLAATEHVEEAAVARSVINFRNAYHRAGGGTVWLNWYCAPYKEGATLSVVRMRIEHEADPPQGS